MATDEDKHGHTVSQHGIPIVEQPRLLLDELPHLVLWRGSHEEAVLPDPCLSANLLKQVAHVGVLDCPDQSLGANDLARPRRDGAGKLVDVKRAAALVDKRGDVVLEHLRVLVLLGVLHRVEPRGGGVGVVEVEAPGVEDLVHGHVALGGLHDDGLLLQAAHDGPELGELLGRHEVCLVEHERGAELDLLDEQGLDVLLVDVLLEQVLPAPKLLHHARRIDDGHDVVEGERRRSVIELRLVAEGRDGVGDGDGLADARGLDDDVVELTRVGDAGELASEVVGEGAADAAVGHRDELVGLGETTLLDEVGVDVDLADVVDDDGRANALVVGEDAVEQRRLASPEIAGDEDDLDLLGIGCHGCLLCLSLERVESSAVGVKACASFARSTFVIIRRAPILGA